MYKKAIQLGITFPSVKGNVTLQDLFDLPLKGACSLNAIARQVSRNLKEAEGEEDFVGGVSVESTAMNLQLDIVKDVIKTRLQEVEVEEAKRDSAIKKSKARQILAERKEKAMDEMTDEELEALANS